MPKHHYAAAGLVLAAALIADLTGPLTASTGARFLLVLVLLVATRCSRVPIPDLDASAPA